MACARWWQYLRSGSVGLLTAWLFALTWLSGPAQADAAAIVRDDEIRHALRAQMDPLLAVAGLDPEGVELTVLNADSINAFVAGGQTIYLHTGLLQAVDSAAEVQGVIAHEIGHIAGGHLVRLADEADTARRQAMISTLLGIATAIGTGRGDAGVAVAAAGQEAAAARLAGYSRTEEQAADQAAVTYLEAIEQSPQGLLRIMERLADAARGRPTGGPDYLRTHPAPQDRIAFLEEAVAQSPYRDATVPAAHERRHARIVAKIDGFLGDPRTTLDRYAADSGIPARYARTIAQFEMGRHEQALAGIDALLAERPDDPYFLELKGRILKAVGRSDAAVVAYDRAVRASPEPRQARIGLARALIARGGDGDLERARGELRAVLELDSAQPFAWRQLAVVTGRMGETGASALALAEEARLQNRPEAAHQQARRALDELAPGTPLHQQARDLLQTLR